MEKINIMINGLPGNVAGKIAEAAMKDNRFHVLAFSLTGPDIPQHSVTVAGRTVELLRPVVREEKMTDIRSRYPLFIAVDYTHPSAVNDNARFYVRHKIPFVMGTTGGDRGLLFDEVNKGAVPAVIAPNMAKQIVGFQAMMEYAARTFPGLFKGYTLEIEESHQQGKADTSGTARAMVGYFNDLGLDFNVDEIKMVRDPEVQEKQWGIPRAYLGGHGWHTYTLRAEDGSAFFEFKHNVNGRDIYVSGTLDAVRFLRERLDDSADQPACYSMIDVLKRNRFS